MCLFDLLWGTEVRRNGEEERKQGGRGGESRPRRARGDRTGAARRGAREGGKKERAEKTRGKGQRAARRTIKYFLDSVFLKTHFRIILISFDIDLTMKEVVISF